LAVYDLAEHGDVGFAVCCGLAGFCFAKGYSDKLFWMLTVIADARMQTC
jgi:hypothetical protein